MAERKLLSCCQYSKFTPYILRSITPSFYFFFPLFNQGRSQTSEEDEASFKRRRREPLGGYRGIRACPPSSCLMLATALFNFWVSPLAYKAFALSLQIPAWAFTDSEELVKIFNILLSNSMYLTES